MKVKEFISEIRKETPWVNYICTRDHLLVGNPEMEIKKIGVCWVATNKALQQAFNEGINFIISHENPFYLEGTHIYEGYYQAKKEKEKFCNDNDIAIYRLHDGWDQFPEYGIADKYAEITGISFLNRDINSFYHIADLQGEKINDVARKIAKGFKKYGCDHVEILGDKEKIVSRLAIGVGAISDLASMLQQRVDGVVLADDGCCNWIEMQYCLDHNIAVVLVHHSTNELAGIDGMQEYFQAHYPEMEVIRLFEGYEFTNVSY